MCLDSIRDIKAVLLRSWPPKQNFLLLVSMPVGRILPILDSGTTQKEGFLKENLVQFVHQSLSMPNCCSVHMALDIGRAGRRQSVTSRWQSCSAAGASRLEVEGAVSLEDKQGRLAEIGGRSRLGP